MAATLAAVVPISSEWLWPVRMVAREIAPWSLALNLVGVAFTIGRRRVGLAMFVAGLLVASWPFVQLIGTRVDIEEQWRQQRFAAGLRLPGTIDLLRESVPDLQRIPIDAEALTPSLSLYRPPRGGDGQLPVIIDIHGGSWQVGGVRDDETFAKVMAVKGFAVFTVDYRKAPQFTFPSQLDDVREAIGWVHGNARRLRADPERMALIGRSAGGHLAMLAAYASTPLPIRSVINIYGPGDLGALHADPPSPDPLRVRTKLEAFLGGPLASRPDVYRAASPIALVRAKLPPTLHIQGGGDNVVPARLTRAMHQALLSAGSRSLLLDIPWADHSFDAVRFGPSNRVAQSVIDAFLAETLARR